MKPLYSNEYTRTHLMNPDRRYVPACATNIAETFQRIRANQNKASKSAKVRRIR